MIGITKGQQLQTSGKQSKEVVTLYGYTIPIKDIAVWQEKDEWIKDEGYIRCIPGREDLRLHLYIDDRQVKDCTV